MSTAKGYYDALLALSGDPVFAAAQDALVASISDEDIMDVVTHIYKNVLPRARRKRLTTLLLDLVAKAKAHKVGAAPVEDAHGGDDDNDDDDSGGGGVSKDCGGSSGHAAQKGEEPRPAQTAQKQPAQNPTAKANQSSTANKKRTGHCLMQDGKRRRNVSPEPMDDEEDLVKKEVVNDEEEPEVIIADDPEETVDNSTKPSSGSSNSVSSASETDSDTDTSLDRDTPWKRTQKLSVMPDLDLEHSDNEDDEDYTEGLHFDPDNLGPLHPKKVKIPSVKVYLRVPAGGDRYMCKELKDFPITFVKQLIRKFNEDFLKTPPNRRAYREMMSGGKRMEKCVYRHLRDMQNKPIPDLRWNCHFACDSCNEAGKLCAKFLEPWNKGLGLVICPPWVGNIGGTDYEALDTWVRRRSG